MTTSRSADDSTPARIPLDRARVIAAGIAYADAEGIGAVTMRTLAGRLDVVPMALYKHVADKDDLVAGMIDAVVAAYDASAADLPWQDAVRARIAVARDALVRHPWLRSAIEAAAAPTPAVLAHMDAVAGSLFDGGLSADLVHHAMHALGSRIWGFSPEAFSAAPVAGDTDPAVLRAMAARFPRIAAISGDAAARNPSGACEPASEFAFTLDLLLDAIARLHADGWSSDGPRASI